MGPRHSGAPPPREIPFGLQVMPSGRSIGAPARELPAGWVQSGNEEASDGGPPAERDQSMPRSKDEVLQRNIQSSLEKSVEELEYKDLIKTGLPVSFGSTHFVLAEMVTDFRNNKCSVPHGPRCNIEWVDKKLPEIPMEAPKIGDWKSVDPEAEMMNKQQKRVIKAPADLLKQKDEHEDKEDDIPTPKRVIQPPADLDPNRAAPQRIIRPPSDLAPKRVIRPPQDLVPQRVIQPPPDLAPGRVIRPPPDLSGQHADTATPYMRGGHGSEGAPIRPPFDDVRPPFDDRIPPNENRPGRWQSEEDRAHAYPRGDKPPFGEPPTRPPFQGGGQPMHGTENRPPFGREPWEQEGKLGRGDQPPYGVPDRRGSLEHRPPPFDDRRQPPFGDEHGRSGPPPGDERGRVAGDRYSREPPHSGERRYDDMRGPPHDSRGQPLEADFERNNSRSSHEFDNQGHSDQPNVQDVLSKVMKAAKAGEIPGVTLPHGEGGH